MNLLHDYLKINIEKPVSFLRCGYFDSHGAPWVHPTRSIDSYELILVDEGDLYLQQDDTTYHSRPGDLVTFIPGVTHLSYKTSNHRIAFFWLHFLGDVEVVSPDLIYPELNDSFVYIPIHHAFNNLDPYLDQLKKIMTYYQTNYDKKIASNYAMTNLLLSIHESLFTKQEDTTSIYSGGRTGAITQWIHAHSHEQIDYQSIANIFGYNKDYLNKSYKKNTGLSINQSIHLHRLSKAKQLLIHSNKSIKEIAYEVGYLDEKHFMKLFKKYESVTPSSYRHHY